jgi:hypothetical protein
VKLDLSARCPRQTRICTRPVHIHCPTARTDTRHIPITARLVRSDTRPVRIHCPTVRTDKRLIITDARLMLNHARLIKIYARLVRMDERLIKNYTRLAYNDKRVTIHGRPATKQEREPILTTDSRSLRIGP